MKKSRLILIIVILAMLLTIPTYIFKFNSHNYKMKILETKYEKEYKEIKSIETLVKITGESYEDEYTEYILGEKNFPGDPYTIQIFMNSNASRKEENQLGQELSEIKEIEKVEYISKEEAFEYMKELMDSPDIMEGLDSDFMEASYKVKLNKSITDSKYEETSKNIEKLQNIKKVSGLHERYIKCNNMKNDIKKTIVKKEITYTVITDLIILTIGLCIAIFIKKKNK